MDVDKSNLFLYYCKTNQVMVFFQNWRIIMSNVVRIKVVSNDHGHLVGKEFTAQKTVDHGYTNYKVSDGVSDILNFKEEDVVEM